VEYLVLADSPIVLDTIAEGVIEIVDDRTAQLPSYTIEAVRDCRNRPGGFWVASTNPEAAYEAVCGSVPESTVKRAAVLTDGGSRYVDRFHLSDWAGLLNLMETEGPIELIRRIRSAETAETDEDRKRDRRRGKVHDDATAALVDFQRQA
jgi:hypothetical protein